jgi:hypothetical protein
MEIIKLCKPTYNSDQIFENSGLFFEKKNILRKTLSNVAVAACITSKARIKLYKAFLGVKSVGGRVLYCDTDSIFVAFKKNIIIENKLLECGVCFDTNLEDTNIKEAVFALPKTYSLVLQNNKEITKIKGLRASISFNEFKELFYNQQSFKLQSLSNFNKYRFHIFYGHKEYEINLGGYDKREWSADFKNTTPIIF